MIDKMEADFYQAYHRERLVAFANQSTLALQHAQMFTEIQRRVSELEALSSVSAALRASSTVPHVLQAVLQAMVEVLSARIGVAFMLDEEGTVLTSQASFPPAFYPTGVHYALGEGITGHVAQTGQIHVASPLDEDPRRRYKPEEPREISNLKSTIALPLISDDAVLGVIHLGLDTVYDFADDEIRTLKAMCNIVANGLQRIQVMQTLESRVASRTYELEMANEQLQELDKLKSKFIADVSHELRTPITNLGIYIDLLQNGDPEKGPHYISVLQRQVNRLTNLVEATLGLSQLEIANQELQFGPVELNEIVEEILLGHQARAEAFRLQLTVRLQPDLPVVIGNQIQLMQLISNLVTNAINYNQENGQITVETSFTQGESTVCLKVVDTGIGIAQADLPHLFDRFYRGQQTGQSNIPGTGLGLAIVKEIVGLHQGTIGVASQINTGTTFSVCLPVYKSGEPVAFSRSNNTTKALPMEQSKELEVSEIE
jgi:signal transduction histidine kinase